MSEFRGVILPLILIIIFIPPACAGSYDILLNNVWYGGFSSLNTVATHPDFSEIHKTDHFGGSCDIVGWRNMSRIDGIDYIGGNPEDLVVVAIHSEDYLKWNNYVDWIRSDTQMSIDGNNITINVHLTMYWHNSQRKKTATGRSYIKKTYYYDHIYMSDTEQIPIQYICNDHAVQLTYYNNTISPKTIVYISNKSFIYSIEYIYKNESVHEQLMTGRIEKTAKGIEFVNFTYDSGWSNSMSNISHIGRCAVVKGDNFTLENLTVVIHTPYTALNVSNYSMSECNVTANNCISSLVFPILFMLCSSCGLIYYVYKITGR